MMATVLAAVLPESDADLPVLEPAVAVLEKFDIPGEVKVTSAHRRLKATHHYVICAAAAVRVQKAKLQQRLGS